MGREYLDRGQALKSIDEFFDLGRRLRSKRSESREFARRMLYDWAVSLSMDRGLSGVLTTYAIGDFNFDYDAWSVWDCKRLPPGQNSATPPGL